MQKIKSILAEQASQRNLSFEQYISEVRKCQELMQSSLSLISENISLAHQIGQFWINDMPISEEIYEIKNFDLAEMFRQLEADAQSTQHEEILEFAALKTPEIVASWDLSREFTLKSNNILLRDTLDNLKSGLVSASFEQIKELWENAKQVVIFLDTFHYALSAINTLLAVVTI
jgi:hypothetical protein